MGFLLAVLVPCLLYPFSLVIYRLWFSPVAHIPGPLLARATYWYEFYYDVILTGRYTFKIKEFHEQYGPIIRVNPHEVHIHDADFFDEIYAGPAKKRDRWAWPAKAFGLDQVMLTQSSHTEHRRRRAPINSYFSKAKVRSLQPVIEDVLQKLLVRFDQYKLSGKPLPLDTAMFALSNDSVMYYSFGRSEHRIEKDDFDRAFHQQSAAALKKAHLMKHFPIFHKFIQLIPEEKLKRMIPEMASYLQLQDTMKEQVRETQEELSMSVEKGRERTIFHEMMEDKTNPLTSSFSFLWQTGMTVVLGGTITTATVMYITIFHLLKNPAYLKRLRLELASLGGQDAGIAAIENLPYLVGVVREGLRMGGTVTTRLQRIDPSSTTIYVDTRESVSKSYALPAGTPMSSTVLLLHYDPAYYHEPERFKPDRWLGEGGNIPPPERHFFPFIKGTTQCVGMNFAHAQIYLLLYHLFKPGAYGCDGVEFEGDQGKLRLFGTDYPDIEVVGDGLGPIYRPESKGVWIQIE